MEFLIETKHTDKECLKALDEIVAYRPELLKSCYLGCGGGVHVGWAPVDARDENEARNMIPSMLRGSSRIYKVGKFTPEQIASFHK